MALIVTIKDTETGETYGSMIANQKEFKTGSKGYFTNGRMVVGGKDCMVQVQAVQIKSKEA